MGKIITGYLTAATLCLYILVSVLETPETNYKKQIDKRDSINIINKNINCHNQEKIMRDSLLIIELK